MIISNQDVFLAELVFPQQGWIAVTGCWTLTFNTGLITNQPPSNDHTAGISTSASSKPLKLFKLCDMAGDWGDILPLSLYYSQLAILRFSVGTWYPHFMSCQGKWLVGAAEHSLQSLPYPFQMKTSSPILKPLELFAWGKPWGTWLLVWRSACPWRAYFKPESSDLTGPGTLQSCVHSNMCAVKCLTAKGYFLIKLGGSAICRYQTCNMWPRWVLNHRCPLSLAFSTALSLYCALS